MSKFLTNSEKLLSKEDFEETSKILLRRKYDGYNSPVDERVYRKIENIWFSQQ